MSKYRDIVYMVLDKMKIFSDDSDYTEEHVIFLANKFRSFLLKQRYQDIKKFIPQSNYQTLCLNLEKTEAISGLPCEGGYYLKTTQPIPIPMEIGNTRLFAASDYYSGEITFITKDRMRYVGNNKWLKNIIYASRNPDGYLYFTSNNPQFLYLESIRMSALFEDAEKASEFDCNESDVCNILDREFPLESSLITPLIELIVKEIKGDEYHPDDNLNNASDDLSKVNVASKQ